MRVIYDISVLGLGLYTQRANTGVSRFVDNLRLALAAEKEVDLYCCAFNTLEEFLQLRLNSDIITSLKDMSLCRPGHPVAKLVAGIFGGFYPTASPEYGHPLRRKILSKILYAVNSFCGDCVPAELARGDVFHSTFYPLPASVKGGTIKRFITVHDLIPILFPQFFGDEDVALSRKIVASIGPEDWIVTNSVSTKNDLCSYAQIDPSRVFVTPLAASSRFSPCTDTQRLLSVKTRYGIPEEPYVLSVCTFEPRKNLDQVIRSFVQLVQEQKIDNLNLVLVGTKGWDFDRIFSAIEAASFLRERIIVTDYVHDEDLGALYSDAMMFVYPSFYEGFGLPPLEAMQCGVPVITSNTSSLPEVVGNAGLLIDPTDGEALSQAMLDIYSQPFLRESLSGKSLERARLFSWKTCAELTVAAYRTALSAN